MSEDAGQTSTLIAFSRRCHPEALGRGEEEMGLCLCVWDIERGEGTLCVGTQMETYDGNPPFGIGMAQSGKQGCAGSEFCKSGTGNRDSRASPYFREPGTGKF